MVSPLKWSALFIVVNKSAHLGEQTAVYLSGCFMNLSYEPDRQKGGSGEKQGLSLRLAVIFLRNQSIERLHMLLRFENRRRHTIPA